MKWRIWAIQFLFTSWAIVLAVRLVYWQALKHSQLRRQADLQHTSSIIISASRGQILASDGSPLATNQESYLLYVQPKDLPTDLSLLLQAVEARISSDSVRLLTSARNSNLSWLSVSRQISPQTKNLLTKLKIPGVGFEPDPARTYPEGSPSAAITGFVGRNEQNRPTGYFGLEGYYDRQLSGMDGRLIQEKDAVGLPIIIGQSSRIPPQPGHSLLTSVDRVVQFITYRHLSQGLVKYQAVSGTVTILESRTGRVLAMVSLPSYDPQHYSTYPASLFKNPIVSDSYEPGSTFKAIVMAAALDAGVVQPQTLCDICSGPVVIQDKVVRSWNDKYFPGSSMTEVILHSDNVGMVFVSRKLGKKRFLEYLRRFGIGKPTGIDVQEESIPPLRPDRQWYDIDWATASFGQGIALTPLQMTAAVNTIANGGKFIAPRLVTHIVAAQSQRSVSPPQATKVISPAAAAAITEMMINGVKKGEVRYYRPPGYLIAGKTGTAQVPIEGHYDPHKTIASFVGFAPADNPKFTMLVTLREPKTSPWGSTTSAPLWFDIARDLFRHFQIPPQTGL